MPYEAGIPTKPTAAACAVLLIETTGFLAVRLRALVRTSGSRPKRCSQVKISPRRRQSLVMWFAFSQSDIYAVCLRGTRYYSATARSSLYDTDNRITKPCLPFKTTTTAAASTCGRPWWSKAITSLKRCCQWWDFSRAFPTAYRKFYSSFARLLRCRKMLPSVSSQKWRTTWRRSKVFKAPIYQLQHPGESETTAITRYRKSEKHCSLSPSPVGGQPQSPSKPVCWYHERSGAKASFQQTQENSTASQWTPTRLALLPSFDFMTRVLNWIFLITTGAALGVFPAWRSDRFKKGYFTLPAANNCH